MAREGVDEHVSHAGVQNVDVKHSTTPVTCLLGTAGDYSGIMDAVRNGSPPTFWLKAP